MVTIENINEIFDKITEQYQEPTRIGSNVESATFYRVEDLSDDDLRTCAEYVAHRLHDMVTPQKPKLFLKLPGGYTFFAEQLTAIYSELYGEIPLEQYKEAKLYNGVGEKYAGSPCVLITDVITTGRSTLEAHTKATLRGIPVLVWACLIDRTLGPGPVPVVSSFTGAPVRTLTRIG